LAGIDYGSDGYNYGSNGPAGLDYGSGGSPGFDYSTDGFAGIDYDYLDSDGTDYGSDDLEGIGEPHLTRTSQIMEPTAVANPNQDPHPAIMLILSS
jgi:hypothetical protein